MSKEVTKDAGAGPFFKDCPHWGKGGSYTFDPVSGQRTKTTGNEPGAEGVPEKAAIKTKEK
ncbi:hypothetical protein AB4Z19_19005 [Pseudoduganella sp. RAF19]|uniref:hypothetical protein n=1 Tax=Pseudoduganella sp. RAF19 TaxID=3233052 RepID=UPI003F97BA29